METQDLLRSSAALRRRVTAFPNGTQDAYRENIDALADSALVLSDPLEVSLRAALCVVRSLALLGRPLDALAAFDGAVRDSAMQPRPNARYAPAEDASAPHGPLPGVKATILSHTNSGDSSSGETHQFLFELRGSRHKSAVSSIALATARVLSSETDPTTAFAQMIEAIVNTEDSNYDGLVGRVFEHL
ncbi:hypothetical protein [Cupriavidus taiwanensis]|uniref:Uncharacterized protein n=1 Tax=Cupriavidus taiwanensis (strain DSM 17343 / BCRC 17206 / CCUG 44338 / CIP 107171 / LMG 19424 / R1) TaxID=977880 RepID=B3R9D2_CUPTR|nr:hypothetical protein [Cupriavidus taiwanensis]CAQ71507.1 hypothetical protein RALTA_B0891 [Cupriavidus taiwanensis LMG 19424]